MNILVDLSVLL